MGYMYICQQHFTETVLLKLTIEKIICCGIGFQSFCHSAVWIGFPNGTAQAIFTHEPLNFLDIHQNRRIHVQQAHMDAPNAFVIAPVVVCLKDSLKIQPVSLLPGEAVIRGGQPVVVAGTENSGDSAKFPDIL